MIHRVIAGYIFAIFMLVGLGSLIPMQSAHAVEAGCESGFLTFPAWYHNLPSKVKGDGCALKGPNDMPGPAETKLSRYIWIIVLNVLNILLQVVVYIAAGFIIWGGFMYLISGGQSDKITTARKMIQHAVIGLTISLFAVFAVSFVSGWLQK
jgi:hypothetical protein